MNLGLETLIERMTRDRKEWKGREVPERGQLGRRTYLLARLHDMAAGMTTAELESVVRLLELLRDHTQPRRQ